MRILLVEDEQPLAKYVVAGLRKHGFAVDLAVDGGTALEKCLTTPYDVVVLDRDRVKGLDLGADDYLGKPFAFTELVARVRALCRRTSPAHPPVLRAADVVLDPAKRVAERGGRLLSLTPKEFGVLEQLLAAGGAVVSAETLLDKVWDEHADPFTNSVRITVGTLRRKLGDPPVVDTVTGAGYRIRP
jgi:DNA-binding response OmpR family regulator